MIIINDLIEKAKEEGFEGVNANAKVAQDIILYILSKIEYNTNITVKGGVLMRNVSRNIRRATQDLDLDLIKYSIEDSAIRKIINRMDGVENIDVNIKGEMEELKQEDYKGKRVYLVLKDNEGTEINTKIDFGVHTDLTIEQEEYCFDVGFNDDGIVLLANTKEQMFVEKLCSLLKHGAASTRYKDIYDMYYLIEFIDKDKLNEIMLKLIYSNENLKEQNIFEVIKRLEKIFSNKQFIVKASNPKSNWLNYDIKIIINGILVFLNKDKK